MKHDINLFTDHYGKDDNEPGDLLNIIYHGATFGHFLQFFIEKFSKLTPDIEGDPFTDIGTSHGWLGKKKLSQKVQAYHAEFIQDNLEAKDLPICLILPRTKKHFLYLKKGQLYRPGNQQLSPNMLYQKAIGEMPERMKHYVESIISLYQIEDPAHYTWIPKFIVRDWYKLEFIQKLEDTHNWQWYQTLEGHDFFNHQRVFKLDMEAFFDQEQFISQMRTLDQCHRLDLDFDREKDMRTLFQKAYDLDQCRIESELAMKIINLEEDIPTNNLDVATEAFIYAELEKVNPDKPMPYTNQFFRDTDEIKQFLDHYPHWYKRKNPFL